MPKHSAASHRPWSSTSPSFDCVGLEINANHIRAVREGTVYGTVIPLHIGRTTHVWDIKIYDDREKLVCVSRLTVAIIRKQR
ncbi:hotdog fold thioesterase [Puia sp. P3]|uniref:hotdog fold thioesterase n=1 Tax=Puia sp. P3 TaxID=3423952 RepID=UPI003D669925